MNAFNEGFVLRNGVRMPCLGLGTWQTDGATTIAAIQAALSAGYRLIDTAAAYGNERSVGQAIRQSGLKREEIFVTNVVKIRPVEVGPTGRSRNRAPNREELALFTPWLLREIAQVRPRALVTLGNVPLRALAAEKTTVGDAHGVWRESRAGMPLFPLYHPASIIYRRALAPVYEQDVLRLAASLPGKISAP